MCFLLGHRECAWPAPFNLTLYWCERCRAPLRIEDQFGKTGP